MGDNTEWAIKKDKRNWQHRENMAKKNATQYVLDTTIRKQTQIT
jgi:hypothetical protein